MPPEVHEKVLVLGLGNPVLGDDSVGWHVAARVEPELDCEVNFLAVGGLSLMEQLVGYDKAVLIDAIVTGQNPPGSVTCFTLDDLPKLASGHLTSVHDTSLPAALKLGRALGVSLPKEIIIVGIEAQRIYDFTEALTPSVAAAVPEAARLVVEIVHQLSGEE